MSTRMSKEIIGRFPSDLMFCPAAEEATDLNYHLAIDGISLTMVLVTGISAVSTVLFSWDVEHRQNEFFFWLLLVVAGCYGVFLSADLFLFFAFYELVIVPKYFLIAVFGSTNK